MTVAYINFHAPINQSTVQQLMATCGQLLKEGKNELYLMLSTPGGRVDSGVTLYNLLRAIACELTTHNMGNIDSIGNAVFLAGKTRKACTHSTFMFHGVGFDIHQRFEEKNLREGLDSILADQRRIGDIIADRTRIPKTRAMQLFRDARTKNANDALKYGIVHEVSDLQIPTDSQIITLVGS